MVVTAFTPNPKLRPSTTVQRYCQRCQERDEEDEFTKEKNTYRKTGAFPVRNPCVKDIELPQNPDVHLRCLYLFILGKPSVFQLCFRQSDDLIYPSPLEMSTGAHFDSVVNKVLVRGTFNERHAYAVPVASSSPVYSLSSRSWKY